MEWPLMARSGHSQIERLWNGRFPGISGLGWITGRRPLITDCVEKVENDAAAKISQRSSRSEFWHEKSSWLG
jgi:hypothetical protein